MKIEYAIAHDEGEQNGARIKSIDLTYGSMIMMNVQIVLLFLNRDK